MEEDSVCWSFQDGVNSEDEPDKYSTIKLQWRFETVRDVKPLYARRVARLYLHVLTLLIRERSKYWRRCAHEVEHWKKIVDIKTKARSSLSNEQSLPTTGRSLIWLLTTSALSL